MHTDTNLSELIQFMSGVLKCLLGVEVLSLTMDLVLQGEVKGHVLHFLLDEDLSA